MEQSRANRAFTHQQGAPSGEPSDSQNREPDEDVGQQRGPSGEPSDAEPEHPENPNIYSVTLDYDQLYNSTETGFDLIRRNFVTRVLLGYLVQQFNFVKNQSGQRVKTEEEKWKWKLEREKKRQEWQTLLQQQKFQNDQKAIKKATYSVSLEVEDVSGGDSDGPKEGVSGQPEKRGEGDVEQHDAKKGGEDVLKNTPHIEDNLPFLQQCREEHLKTLRNLEKCALSMDRMCSEEMVFTFDTSI